MIALDQPAPFVCTVTRVHDGDGPIWCKEGPKIRLAGIQAPDFERTEPCRRRKPGYVCSDVRARASQRIVSRMVLHRRLSCVAVDRSYQRVVATCRIGGADLACAIVRAGAADWWPAYVRRYKLGRCS
jgi:endonuclease YncB( thermonuclease family)